jgi:HIP---CoA ligase
MNAPSAKWSCPWQTIPDLLRANAHAYATSEAVSDGDVRLTHSDLWEQSGRVASALSAAGVAPGGRVAAWLPNGWHSVVIACGVWRAGAALVPINTRNRGPEVVEVLAETGTSVLFLPRGFLGTDYLAMLAQELGRTSEERPFAALPSLSHIVEIPSEVADTARFNSSVSALWDAFLATGGVSAPGGLDEAAPTDISEILFTSGTTGRPKGVLLDHRQLLEAYYVYGKIAEMTAGDRYLMVMPFGHGGGLNGCLLTSLIHGMAIVPVDVFEPEKALRLIRDQRVSVVLGPPTLYTSMLDHPKRPEYDTSSVRIAITGAAIVPPQVISRISSDLGAPRVINSYGIIEGTVISMTRADDDIEVIATTTGRALPDVEVRVVTPDGNSAGTGEVGEVWVRSYGVTRGFLDPHRTAEMIDADRWLHTGDLGSMDPEGNLRIVDRLKDVIDVGGYSAYPAEIERTLLNYPGLLAVAVVAMPDRRLGEVPCAFVVAHPEAKLVESEVIEWAHKLLANYKVPRRVVLLDALPLNRTDKVDKIELRSRAPRF